VGLNIVECSYEVGLETFEIYEGQLQYISQWETLKNNKLPNEGGHSLPVPIWGGAHVKKGHFYKYLLARGATTLLYLYGEVCM